MIVRPGPALEYGVIAVIGAASVTWLAWTVVTEFPSVRFVPRPAYP